MRSHRWLRIFMTNLVLIILVLVGLILAFLMVSGGQAAELIAAGIAALVASLPAVNAVVSLIAKRSSAA